MVLAQHSHPHPRHSTCSALASWASSGSLPLGKATISSNFLSLCVSLPLNLSYLALCLLVRACSQEELHGGGVTVFRGTNVSYLVLRVLVRACRQEELHGGGATVGRGPNECRVAILYMRGKRRWRKE